MVGLQLSRSSAIKEAEKVVLGVVSSGERGLAKAGSCRENRISCWMICQKKSQPFIGWHNLEVDLPSEP